jgi:hypothetical protein
MNNANSVCGKNLKCVELLKNVEIDQLTAFRVSGGNNGALLYLEAPEITKLEIKGGNSVFGGEDCVIDIDYGTNLIPIETGPFIQVSGENKGCILMQTPGKLTIAELIELG